jgi:hypothetical protein
MSFEREENARRTADRAQSNLEAGIRRTGGHSFRVTVFDLSTTGCKIEFIERPAVGERVWVRFDGLSAVEGTVRWVAGHIGGVQFQHPLHEAIFRRLVG